MTALIVILAIVALSTLAGLLWLASWLGGVLDEIAGGGR